MILNQERTSVERGPAAEGSRGQKVDGKTDASEGAVSTLVRSRPSRGCSPASLTCQVTRAALAGPAESCARCAMVAAACADATAGAMPRCAALSRQCAVLARADLQGAAARARTGLDVMAQTARQSGTAASNV